MSRPPGALVRIHRALAIVDEMSNCTCRIGWCAKHLLEAVLRGRKETA